MFSLTKFLKINNIICFKHTFSQGKYLRCISSEKRFPIKIDRSIKVMTMKEIKSCIMERLGLETVYTPNPKPREHLLQYQPKLEDLPPRSMNDSFCSAIIPLSTSRILSDTYVTARETVRLGRLMEDMDMFAVWVCHKHLFVPNLDKSIHLPYTFVTILIDKIDFSDVRPTIKDDIRISGHVSWVGTSSIEVVVWLEILKLDGSLEKITKARFLMGSRNATNTKAAPINPLKADNEYEENMLLEGTKRKIQRSVHQEISLLKVLPTQEEQKLMHDAFIKTLPTAQILSDERVLPDGHFWMDKTKIVDVDIAFPENRNAHNTIFGGFLMRRALETSYINAALYSNDLPHIKHISNIIFHRPVEVNTILKMTTFVTYTEDNFVQVICLAETRHFDTKPVLTNIFHFTYLSSKEVLTVLPKTYQENIWNLIGRREFIYSKSN